MNVQNKQNKQLFKGVKMDEVKETIHRWEQFNADQDADLIAAGTHFYCKTHMTARPNSEKSPDPRYCQGCYEFLLNEAAMLSPNKKPSWVPKDGGTPDLNHADTKQSNKNDVTKIIQQGNLPSGIMLQEKRRGRPLKKEGETITRMTAWRRRQKEQLQGVLIDV
jgi:hypothetical protein